MARPTLRRGAEAEQERTRRRFARRQWARRWLTWRYVVAAIAVLALLGGGIYAVYFSDALSVRGVEVAGEASVAPEEVLEAAAVALGGPLATADLSGIERRVENIDAVQDAEVTRQWPDDVRIEITEREAVAVIDRGGEFRAVDASGAVFDSFARAPSGLPRIQAADLNDVEALRSAAVVLAALTTEVRTIVDHLEVEGVDEIALALDGGRTVRWGSSSDSSQKAEVLTALLQQRATVYDVSVPGQPTTSS